ncbi:MAG: response regulator [Bacteroidota bacterium]
MKRILFVDDDKFLLDGLKRSLRTYRKEWKMVFCESGEAALEKLQEAPADVVVSDMRMPGMDGATLLTKVKERHPGTIRIVLTGHTELEAALRSIPIAHNFLNKPTDGKIVKEVIDRALRLQDLLEDEELRRQIDSMNGLPAVPSTYAELTRLMRDEDVTIDDIATVIERDAAIASRILRTVNSGFFGRSNRVSEVKAAINFIGFKLLETLVLSVEVFQNSSLQFLSSHYDLEKEQRHALLVAHIASALDPLTVDANQAFMAGLLHDVGKLVLAAQLPEKFARAIEIKNERGIPLYQAELELSSFSHAEIGAYLPNLWGLAYPIIEAIANHHVPWRIAEQEGFNLVAAVYLANNLGHKYSLDEADQLTGEHEALNLDYLSDLGVIDKLPEWERIAEEIAMRDKEIA